MSDSEIRIAMWSGPRNISTALLRSFGSRRDTFVCDEPLYSHYLRSTKIDHPGRDEIIAECESDWKCVVEWLTGPIPEERPVFYQKHMAHHVLPEIGRSWIGGLTNCFLVREPTAMLASLAKVLPHTPALTETGLPQQLELFESLRDDSGKTPPVIDSSDVLRNPEGVLSALCERVGIPWDAAMLSWKAGPRETDGVWAKHWYANVERSTGFAPYSETVVSVPEALRDVHEECERIYSELAQHRIT